MNANFSIYAKPKFSVPIKNPKKDKKYKKYM